MKIPSKLVVKVNISAISWLSVRILFALIRHPYNFKNPVYLDFGLLAPHYQQNSFHFRIARQFVLILIGSKTWYHFVLSSSAQRNHFLSLSLLWNSIRIIKQYGLYNRPENRSLFRSLPLWIGILPRLTSFDRDLTLPIRSLRPRDTPISQCISRI